MKRAVIIINHVKPEKRAGGYSRTGSRPNRLEGPGKKRGVYIAKGRENLATEILGQMKGKLIRCRIALVISLGINAVLAAVLIFR